MFIKEKGPWHGLPVSTPYMTKDHLEMKRSKAQAANTTYVYDFPELFKLNVAAAWKDYLHFNGARVSFFYIKTGVNIFKQRSISFPTSPSNK